ncbi:Guanylate cyclase soluble subunit beta-1 [Pseudolycoriella hygida]|uniref:Guanylate cyclase soluble subunit beta-1 n=1 Tax=Pseudolycoriella hygida TaxID=35572 RepID=A0A9Q0S1N0_9DIPT|nr:Guanylate cyclase soluble subunit beta-1 [Pseudolycoriella hygida]
MGFKLIDATEHVVIILVNELNIDPSFHLEYRGPVIMKGKPDPMKCWFLSRNTGAAAAVTPSCEEYPLNTST